MNRATGSGKLDAAVFLKKASKEETMLLNFDWQSKDALLEDDGTFW